MVEKFRSSRNSLRSRFVIGIAIMLLPVAILVACATIGLQQTVANLERIVDDPIEEIVLAQSLQNRMLRSAFPFQAYINNGRPSSKGEYLRLTGEIDQRFEQLLGFKYLGNDERRLITAARGEWQRSRAVAEQILQGKAPVGDADISVDINGVEVYLNGAVKRIGEFTSAALEEARQQRELAESTKSRFMTGMLAIFGLGFLVSVTAAVVLARSVLSSIRQVKESCLEHAGDGSLREAAQRPGDELGSLEAAFNSMAAKLEKVQNELEYLSTHDALTGLCDRKKFHEVLRQEIQRATRYGHTFAVLLIDVDSFKKVNNTYGRLVGDSVLCTVATQITNSLRPTDLAARYRSEEVAVILSETSVEGAMETAERIRKTLAEKPLNIGDGRAVSLTVSVGVAVFPDDAANDLDLFEAVDNALRTAKALGRNRVYANSVRNRVG